MLRRTNCVGFAKIFNCSCVWCTKFLGSTQQQVQVILFAWRRKKSVVSIHGMYCSNSSCHNLILQADTTTNKLNQRKLITGRHRDKDILSCEKANTGRHQDMISFPVETQTSRAGIETKISFPVIETTTTARQDLLNCWKGWNRSKIRLDPCILGIWTDTNSIKKACCLEYREH